MSDWCNNGREWRTESWLDDTSIEAMLRGEPVPREVVAVSTAIGVLRSAAELPVQPNPELAERLATGDFGPEPAHRPKHVAAAPRTTANLGLRAKIGIGLVVGVSGLAAATAAGALPASVQRGLEATIEFLTPIDLGDDAPTEDGSGGGGGELVDYSEFGEQAREPAPRPTSPAGAELSQREVVPGDEPSLSLPPDPGTVLTPEPAGDPVAETGGVAEPVQDTREDIAEPTPDTLVEPSTSPTKGPPWLSPGGSGGFQPPGLLSGGPPGLAGKDPHGNASHDPPGPPGGVPPGHAKRGLSGP